VIIGGSFLASGDLHPTPLGALMPGAVINANAIRAFSLGQVSQEHHLVLIELALILVAAAITVTFSWLADWSSSIVPRRVWRIVYAIVLILGLVLAGCATFMIALKWAYQILESRGTVLGALTPALLITCEGFFRLVHRGEHLLENALRRRLQGGRN
jgi:hypothetical protein